jgi:hypothetical protein
MTDPAIHELFTQLVRLGLVDVLLPFVLVFAIVFGVLEKSRALGKEQHHPNELVAFAIAAIFVVSISLVNLMNKIIWAFSTLVVMAISAMIIIALFGIRPKDIFRRRR